jgi:hypothetical protein
MGKGEVLRLVQPLRQELCQLCVTKATLATLANEKYTPHVAFVFLGLLFPANLYTFTKNDRVTIATDDRVINCPKWELIGEVVTNRTIQRRFDTLLGIE